MEAGGGVLRWFAVGISYPKAMAWSSLGLC